MFRYGISRIRIFTFIAGVCIHFRISASRKLRGSYPKFRSREVHAARLILKGLHIRASYLSQVREETLSAADETIQRRTGYILGRSIITSCLAGEAFRSCVRADERRTKLTDALANIGRILDETHGHNAFDAAPCSKSGMREDPTTMRNARENRTPKTAINTRERTGRHATIRPLGITWHVQDAPAGDHVTLRIEM